LQEPETDKVKPGPIKRLYNLINAVKELEEEPKIPEEPVKKTPEGNSHTQKTSQFSNFSKFPRALPQGFDQDHCQLGRGLGNRDSKTCAGNV
jgi:hypothetical protein